MSHSSNSNSNHTPGVRELIRKLPDYNEWRIGSRINSAKQKNIKQASNGKSKGNRVSWSSRLIPQIGPSLGIATEGVLAKSLNAGVATVRGNNGLLYKLPSENLYYEDEELTPGKFVVFYGHDGKTLGGGNLKTISKNKATFYESRFSRPRNTPPDVNMSKVASFTSNVFHNRERVRHYRHNLALKRKEVQFIRRLKEKDARQLLPHAIKRFLRLMQQIDKYHQFGGATLTENEEPRKYRLMKHHAAHYQHILKTILRTYPKLGSTLPLEFVGEYINNKFDTPANNDLSARRRQLYRSKQMLKQLLHGTHAEGRFNNKLRGSSSKPIILPYQKKNGKNRLTQHHNNNTIELHHIITATDNQRNMVNNLMDLKVGQKLSFNGDTYWHSDEMWDWKGTVQLQHKVKPVARLIKTFRRNNNKLVFTGHHKYSVHNKQKSAFLHKGPLNLYVYRIGNDGEKKVMYVR